MKWLIPPPYSQEMTGIRVHYLLKQGIYSMQISRICVITCPELYELYVVDLTRKTYPTKGGKGYSHSRTHPFRAPEGTSRPLQEDQKELTHPLPPPPCQRHSQGTPPYFNRRISAKIHFKVNKLYK